MASNSHYVEQSFADLFEYEGVYMTNFLWSNTQDYGDNYFVYRPSTDTRMGYGQTNGSQAICVYDGIINSY